MWVLYTCFPLFYSLKCACYLDVGLVKFNEKRAINLLRTMDVSHMFHLVSQRQKNEKTFVKLFLLQSVFYPVGLFNKVKGGLGGESIREMHISSFAIIFQQRQLFSVLDYSRFHSITHIQLEFPRKLRMYRFNKYSNSRHIDWTNGNT